MRKVILAGVLAALGSAVLAVPASASFDPHFTVFEKARFHVLQNEEVFTIRGGLYDPLNHDNRVGSDHARCKIRPHETLRCRGVIHLNGEIGGSGDIKYRGNIRPHDFRLNVTGGSVTSTYSEMGTEFFSIRCTRITSGPATVTWSRTLCSTTSPRWATTFTVSWPT